MLFKWLFVKTCRNIDSNQTMSGSEAARTMLSESGISDISVHKVNTEAEEDFLGCSYNEELHSVNLTESVYEHNSLADVCVSCHEVAHAFQYRQRFIPLQMRNALAKVLNVMYKLILFVCVVAICMDGFCSEVTYNATERFSYYILGVFLFLMVLYGSTETYVEVKASSVALSEMLSLGIIESEDTNKCKRLYSVALLSYADELILEVVLFVEFYYLFFFR